MNPSCDCQPCTCAPTCNCQSAPNTCGCGPDCACVGACNGAKPAANN